MNSTLIVLHPSLLHTSPAVTTLRTVLAPCLIKDMLQPMTEQELSTCWRRFLLCAPPTGGEDVFAWLSTNPSLLSTCSEVGFIEFGEDPEEDTWLLDQRFWQFSTLAIPLADRFGTEDILCAKDFALALLDRREA